MKTEHANLAFVSQDVELCVSNPGILPRAIDIAETTRKAEAHASLLRLEARIKQTLETVRESASSSATKLYAVCLTVYELTGRPLLGAGMKTGCAPRAAVQENQGHQPRDSDTRASELGVVVPKTAVGVPTSVADLPQAVAPSSNLWAACFLVRDPSSKVGLPGSPSPWPEFKAWLCFFSSSDAKFKSRSTKFETRAA